MENKIEVSIVCNTFNHENYISDAIEGFLAQKTDFDFEILIHDDASKDGTADIIRRYEIQNPGRICAIYQSENQYSQGKNISLEYQFPRAKGKYIALCEGDDYWIDPLKLQKQYDLMEKCNNVDLCGTASILRNAVSGTMIGKQSLSKEQCIIPPSRFIEGGGGLVSTASLFGRKDFFCNPLPFRGIYSYDYTIQIQGSLRGGMLYIPDETVVYRVGVTEGWVTTMNKNPSRKIAHHNKVLLLLKQLNKDTNGKYFLSVSKKYAKVKCQIIRLKVHNVLRKLRGIR